VLIERPTEYQELLARHGSREQARFFLGQRGQRIEDLAERHEQHRRQHQQVLAAVPPEWRRAGIQREDLDRFLFEPNDVIVVLGQDGLVANVAKYLNEQPVIGLNPTRAFTPACSCRTHPKLPAS
jgi:NAD kinase